jgi:hypothetical protein
MLPFIVAIIAAPTMTPLVVHMQSKDAQQLSTDSANSLLMGFDSVNRTRGCVRCVAKEWQPNAACPGCAFVKCTVRVSEMDAAAAWCAELKHAAQHLKRTLLTLTPDTLYACDRQLADPSLSPKDSEETTGSVGHSVFWTLADCSGALVGLGLWACLAGFVASLARQVKDLQMTQKQEQLNGLASATSVT